MKKVKSSPKLCTNQTGFLELADLVELCSAGHNGNKFLAVWKQHWRKLASIRGIS